MSCWGWGRGERTEALRAINNIIECGIYLVSDFDIKFLSIQINHGLKFADTSAKHFSASSFPCFAAKSMRAIPSNILPLGTLTFDHHLA